MFKYYCNYLYDKVKGALFLIFQQNKFIMLQEQITEQIKEAMLAKDVLKLKTLRSIKAAFLNELISKGKKPTDNLSDEDALSVIKRIAKQHKDSIKQFEDGGRVDLVENEKEELKYIEPFLPKMMSIEDVKKVAESKKQKLGISDISKKGILIGIIMKELNGRAEGSDVKKVVEDLLNQNINIWKE